MSVIDNLKNEIENLKKEIEKLNNLSTKKPLENLKEKKSYMVEWYKKNKEKHLEKLKNKSVCECGEYVSYGNRVRHNDTSKHIKKLASKTLLDSLIKE
jgi:pyruvate-formate lyase-activating enzyme